MAIRPVIMAQIEKDRNFSLAESYVKDTDVSVFLTGKAGTGKTTFLRSIVEETGKRCAVVAPTGVAAINAGGVTIHSFFQLPLCPYLPDVPELLTEYQMTDRNFHMRKDRLKILRTLDLLIIDEVSMVRADLMDAMDMVLRLNRRSDLPFGGVQLLMIGDLQQLPPVVTDSERPYMERVYPSPFFFNSKALQKLNHIVISLEKVHRQADANFVDLLNDIRGGSPSPRTLEVLNSRLDPSFNPPENEGWIRLTTHNRQADSVNMEKLAALPGKAKSFSSETEGNFPENSYPVESELQLKKGAQVMFVRNDNSGESRYYNGKIATVLETEPELVVTDTEGNAVTVGREEWQNVKYEIDPEDNEIKAIVEGVYRQYPLRLAWAVTIHKSQGLTFDHVMIDAASAFSSGQVYVALSRCRSLEGIVLSSPITRRGTFSDPDVRTYEDSRLPLSRIEQELDDCRRAFLLRLMCEAFDFSSLRYSAGRIHRIWQVDIHSMNPSLASAFSLIYGKKGGDSGIWYIKETADNFQKQIRRIFISGDEVLLAERIHKASVFFTGALLDVARQCNEPLDVKPSAKEVAKSFKNNAMDFVLELRFRLGIMAFIRDRGFMKDAFLRARLEKELSPETRISTALRSLGSLVASLDRKK